MEEEEINEQRQNMERTGRPSKNAGEYTKEGKEDE